MEFQYSDSGFCNGGRFEGMSKWLHGHAFRLRVQGRNLQSFMETEHPQLLPRIRYVKIDTEGYESAVLASLPDLIAHNRPFLKLEVYRKLDETRRQALYCSIAGYGYVVRKIADDGNYFGEILTERDMNKWRHFDVFCAPGT
jgi:hypothetical protein